MFLHKIRHYSLSLTLYQLFCWFSGFSFCLTRVREFSQSTAKVIAVAARGESEVGTGTSTITQIENGHITATTTGKELIVVQNVTSSAPEFLKEWKNYHGVNLWCTSNFW